MRLETGATVCRWEPTDDLTIYTACEHKRALEPLLGISQVLEVDLSGIRELDTAGAQLLLLARRELESSGRRMTIVGCTPELGEVLEIYGLRMTGQDLNGNRSGL